MDAVVYLYFALALLLIWFSYKSFRGGIDYLRYFSRELTRPRTDYTPFACVIAPCRGLDEDLAENLAALLKQNYLAYELLFVVDSPDDPALSVIEELTVDGRARLVIAPTATDSSQKVENLREAVLQASERAGVFVFVDSDARPGTNWLRDLVAPLADDKVGATTGYRWFISKRFTFASEMRNMWNASIASALGPNRRSNFCWGGSMAIRREVFERLGIRDKWSGTLSDDFTVTRAMNDADLEIYFVPQALTASIESCDLKGLIEFTNRQMKITRVYAAKLWLMSFFGSGLFCIVMLATLLLVIFSTRNDVWVLMALFTLVVVTTFSVGKSWLRLEAVRLVLKDHDAALRRQFLPQITLWALTPALFLGNCVAALSSRRVKWRGTGYEMISPTETRILRSAPNER